MGFKSINQHEGRSVRCQIPQCMLGTQTMRAKQTKLVPAFVLIFISVSQGLRSQNLVHVEQTGQDFGIQDSKTLWKPSRNLLSKRAKIHPEHRSPIKRKLESISGRLSAAANESHIDFDISSLTEIIGNGVRHPLVFWPGFGTSSIEVKVENQQIDPNCPQYGTFHVSFGSPTILEGWSEACVYKMLELDYDSKTESFLSKPGVKTSVADFGSTSCASIPYEPMYLYLEALGYTNGLDFLVACYDWRMDPYRDVGTDFPHLQMAKELVEQAYKNTGLPVYLAGHSNGPLYTMALLNSVSEDWRRKHIAGFIGLAGNWAGQGGTLAFLFSGQSLFDSSWMPASAKSWQSWPASYMQLSDPKIYSDQEIILKAQIHGESRKYTPQDYDTLFKDADLKHSRNLAKLFVGNVSAAKLIPQTHFYGFYGSGSLTRVGVTLSKLIQGLEPLEDQNFYRDGDGDQEDIDNKSPLLWQGRQASCFHFELNEMEGSTHLGIPFAWRVLYRLAQIVYTGPEDCSIEQ